MQTDVSLRTLNEHDGMAYATLIANSPDTGRINAATHFEIDLYQALMMLHEDTVGVVAEAPGYDGLAGGGLIRFGHCQYEDQVRPYALLNTLVVHPQFRRRGVASRLAQWRVEVARQRLGDNAVIWAIIQHGNTGSELTAKKWRRQFLPDRLVLVPAKMRTAPPPQNPNSTIRPIQPAEFDQVAEQLNRFYRTYNLYTLETGESLAAWCAQTAFESPFHHYFIVVDDAGSLLAGISVAENYRLRTVHIGQLPLTSRVMNAILHVVPPDGIVRELGASRIWYAPGQLKAAQYLWETMRWQWRDRATAILALVDVRSPLLEVLSLRPWTIKSKGSIAIQGPTAMSDDRLIYYSG